jgi:hypothetical protein
MKGKLAAEVSVQLIETEDGWSPYLSVEDARKLDDVREALGGAMCQPLPAMLASSV